MANCATDFVILRFPTAPIDRELIAELKVLSGFGMIRIRDILFATRDESGMTLVQELVDVDDAIRTPWEDLVGGIDRLLSPADSEYFTQDLPPSGSIVAVLVEECWSVQIDRAMRRAGGTVVFHERIPRGIMDRLESLQGPRNESDANQPAAEPGPA